MNQDNYKSLQEKGWTEFISGSSDSELISIASKVGNIQKHPNGQNIFNLKPKQKNESFKGTFSNTCGLREFPFHTDTAFFKKPARYILMHSKKRNNCATTLLPRANFWNVLSKADIYHAKRAVYIIKTKTEKFYTSFIFQEEGETGLKYDPSCMFPFNKHAKEFDLKFKKVLSKSVPLRIQWTEGKTIIIDNWLNLHGREAVGDDKTRELKRIYIN